MPPRIKPIELEHLEREFDNSFNGFIDGVGGNEQQRKANFYTKSIAAFVLVNEAGATTDEAVEASIDGQNDHGIDSVYVDATGTLWLIQTKYIQSGSGEPDLGDVSKFRDGVVDLLACKFDRFNEALQAKEQLIREALDAGAKVKVILAYTGGAISSEEKREIFEDIENRYNRAEPQKIECHFWGLNTLYDIFLSNHRPEPIDIEVKLRDFGYIEEPYRGYYGRISAQQLTSLYNSHGDLIVEKNIRRFKGSTAVNNGMKNTLQESSKHFFYYNNGITFLCSSIRQLGALGDNAEGKFKAENISVINGAQTLGTIASKDEEFYDENPAEVLVTFISTEQAPENFEKEVTKYRNRQNVVDLDDFASLDEKQEYLKSVLQQSGITYIYKKGDSDPSRSESVFFIKEAATALACCNRRDNWSKCIVLAKTNQKKLLERPIFSDSEDEFIYDTLFSDTLTAKSLWRAVQSVRFLEQTLQERASGSTGDEQIILRDGKWLIMHIVLNRLNIQNQQNLQLSDENKQKLSEELDSVAQKVVDVTSTENWGKQYQSVFANETDCNTIKQRVMREFNNG